MKMNLKSIFLYSLAILAIVACDQVDDPYADYTLIGEGDSEFNDTTYNDSNLMVRKIMLEEFTGHKCPNCPSGTAFANQIKSENSGQFFVVAIHNSNDFSIPEPPKYPSDFRTETGEKLRTKYDANGFPVGLLNRIDFGTGSKVSWVNWKNEVDALTADANFNSPYFKVKLENIYNRKSTTLRVRPTIETLKPVTGDVMIGAYILEDSIVAPQIDGSTRIENYVHNHLLRTGFPANGEGKLLFTNPAVGDMYNTISITDEIGVMIQTEKWALEHLELVVFIFNKDSGEVLWTDYMSFQEH